MWPFTQIGGAQHSLTNPNRQTDRKWCKRAHWALAQVDTIKTGTISGLSKFKVCWASGNRGIFAHCIIMLFWTTGYVPFFFIHFIVMAQRLVNMKKTITWVLWILVNSGFFIFLYWNQSVLGRTKNYWRPLYWSRTIGNKPFLFHIWPLVGLKFPLSFVKRTSVLNITMCPKGLKVTIGLFITLNAEGRSTHLGAGLECWALLTGSFRSLGNLQPIMLFKGLIGFCWDYAYIATMALTITFIEPVAKIPGRAIRVI